MTAVMSINQPFCQLSWIIFDIQVCNQFLYTALSQLSTTSLHDVTIARQRFEGLISAKIQRLKSYLCRITNGLTVVLLAHTVDGELSSWTESSTGNILSDTRVVSSVTESHLADDDVTFIGDDHVDVLVSIHRFVVFQPVHLQLQHQHHPYHHHYHFQHGLSLRAPELINNDINKETGLAVFVFLRQHYMGLRPTDKTCFDFRWFEATVVRNILQYCRPTLVSTGLRKLTIRFNRDYSLKF